MPLTKAQVAANSTANFMTTFRMMQKFNKAIAAIEAINSAENEEILKKLHKLNAGLGRLSVKSIAESMDDEEFKDLMSEYDNLPVYLSTETQPDGKTVLEHIQDGLSPEEQSKSFSEIQEFYKAYDLTFLKSEEERKAIIEEEEQRENEARRLAEEGDPLEIIPTFTEKQKTGVKKTAARYIEDLKASAEFATFTKEEASRVLAARLLANSIPGSADRLKAKEVYDSEVSKTGEWIVNGTSFDSFWKNNKKKIYDALKARGHGGGIDKLFKEHITNLPAGQLPSRALYTRYMPTAFERIDALKKKIKSGNGDIYAAAAEIAVLRNLVKAEQGKKETLNRQLSPEQMAVYKKQVEDLSKDPSFRQIVDEPKSRELVVKGHGGDFLDRVRKAEKSHPDMTKEAKEVLNSGTLGAHMDNLKKKAAKLRDELKNEMDYQGRLNQDDRDMTSAWRKIENTKQLLAEYIACDNISRKPVKGTVDVSARLLQDVPELKIGEQIAKRDSNPTFRSITDGISPAKAIQILDDLATKQPDEVLSGLVNEQILPDAQSNVPKKTGVVKNQEVNQNEFQGIQN